MIRIHVFMFSLVLSAEVFAGCSETISGGGVDISDGGCATEELMINGQYKFSEECKDIKNGFACRKDGHSPIAGATYVLTNDAKPHCKGEKVGKRYTCIKGCAKPVPKHLEIVPYEC